MIRRTFDPNGRDYGAGIDPNGRKGDEGGAMDPNGKKRSRSTVLNPSGKPEGNGLDPHGRSVKGEEGPYIDPNGKDDGSGLDPHGKGLGVDPNGRKNTRAASRDTGSCIDPFGQPCGDPNDKNVRSLSGRDGGPIMDS